MVAVDLPGHGSNNNQEYSENDFSMESYRKFLLKKILKIDGKIILAGNSLGGHLSIEISKEIPNLAALIIFGTPPVKKPINFEEAFHQVPALATFLTENPTTKNVNEAISAATSNKEAAKILLSDFKTANPKVRPVIAADIMGNKLLNEHEIFTSLELPKYIIKGDRDITVNQDYLEKVCIESKGSCKTFKVENCGHYPTIERPEVFINILCEIEEEVLK